MILALTRRSGWEVLDDNVPSCLPEIGRPTALRYRLTGPWRGCEVLMRSRKFVLGAGGLALLGAGAAVAAVLEHRTVAAVIQVVLLVIVGLLALAGVVSQRRTAREVSRLLRQGVRAEGAEVHSRRPVVEEADLVGALRLLQAQYVGRLDRAQATLERAAQTLSHSTAGASAGRAHVVVPGIDLDYVPVIEAALGAGMSVSVMADAAVGAVWLQEHGWTGDVSVVPPAAGDGDGPRA